LEKVLIIGSGITGITAATSLSQLGHQVVLVDKKQTIGGKLIDLGFVYPTDDCSLCLESSFCHGFDSHRKCQYRSFIHELPGIELHHATEITEFRVDTKNGRILAELSSEERLIDPEKCVACGACAKACPLEAITLDHPQNIPKSYVINLDICDQKKCKKECLDACKEIGAIDLSASVIKTKIEAKAAIIATGFEETCPPHIDGIFALSKSNKVVTQLELSSLLDPIKGKKEFAKRNIKHVVFVLCAGSRDKRFKPECSSLCCSYSLKHALKLKEEFDIDVDIAYMDIRTLGMLEEYYDRSRKAGIRFIRSRPSGIDLTADKVIVYMEDTLTGEYLEVETDLLVLSNPLELNEIEKISKKDNDGSNIYFLNDKLRNIPQSTRAAKAVALEIHQRLRG